MTVKAAAFAENNGDSSPRRRISRRKEQKRSIDTRQSILDAALDEFAERGFDGASVRRIGERAKLDFTLITYHFRNKDTLWREVAGHAFDEILATWDKAIPPDSSMSARDRVRLEFRSYFEFTAKNCSFHNFLLREMQTDSPRLRWLVKEFLDRIRNRILPQIRTAQADGDLEFGDSDLLYYMLIGATSALTSLSGEISITTGMAISDPAIVERYWELLDRIFFRKPPRV